MRIPEQIIDQILQDIDIIDVISEFVPLTKTGANHKACCPFHQEKTPSFVVSTDKQIFHCFGCGVGGNAISFIMQYEKLSYPEAIRKLADRLGIQIALEKHITKEEDNLSQYYKINAYALWFFQNQLKNSQKATSYIRNRLISNEVQKEFELGYAPDGYEALLKFLQDKNVPQTLAAHLGLIKKGDKGYYDFFRDRFMFPIRGHYGKIVGFGGRNLSEKDQAKYINSPESPIYNKSVELYGFFQAKKEILAKKQAVIVEGYMDVLACVEMGIRNVVAPLGTSLTLAQIKKIKRYTSDMILMFDGDLAGKAAALKAVQTCLTAEIHPKLVMLPKDSDPADWLEAQQKDTQHKSLQEVIQEANYALDWIFVQSITDASHKTSQKVPIIRDLIEWISRLTDPIEKMEYRKKLAKYFDISETDLQKMIEITHKTDTLTNPQKEPLSLESLLVLLYIHHSDQFHNRRITELSRDFENEGLKELAEYLENLVKKCETFNVSTAIQAAPQKLQGLLSRLFLFDNPINMNSNVEECIHKFILQKNKKRLKEITAKILNAELRSDCELKDKLLKEKQTLLSEYLMK